MQEHTTVVSASPEVEYVRGSDYGGGIGGLLYSVRSTGASFNHYNSRGDVIAKTDGLGALTYEGQYEAFGKRTEEIGTNIDRQTANTKDEDPHGLLNEGFRYRCLETGAFITRDPMGFVDGPNVYTYVVQNPWSKFDPTGLKKEKVGEVYTIVNHETKEVYIGEVHGETRMQKGGAEDRLSESRHKANELLKKEGTIKTVSSVEADADWRETAKKNGISESSARNTIVKSQELAAADDASKKYKGYNILSSTSITDEKAAKTKLLFSPESTQRKTTIKVGDKWMSKSEYSKHMKQSIKSPRGGGGVTLALGAVGIALAEFSGGNQAKAEAIGEALRMYRHDPNYLNSNMLAIRIGDSFPIGDSGVLALGQHFYEQGQSK